MKKKSIIYYSFLGVLIFLYLLNIFGVCALFGVPTTGSEPNIKGGSYILASNLITPKRGDFITYKFNDPMYGNFINIHRLCGVANDTIQIKKGVLFVNGENFDKQYSLQHSYLLNKTQLDTLKISPDDFYRINEDQYISFIQDADAKKYGFDKHRLMDSKNKLDASIQSIHGQKWNKDHFGPLIIPEGKIFILDDNRDNSQDSRYTGLIDESAITGVYWMTLFTINP